MAESAAHERSTISLPLRAAVVAGASAADMLVNFPLWIVAKRVSAGLKLPAMSELYKGSSALYLAMGPMTVIEDGSTSVVIRGLGDYLSPTVALATAASVSGATGALAAGAQAESIIMRAHATQQRVWPTAVAMQAAGGWRSVLAPHGMAMIVAREVPYSGCLFFLSGQVRSALRSDVGTDRFGILRDMLAAALTALVAGPLSHVPATIASHQQAHAMPLQDACRDIYRASGMRGFLSGLVPRTVSLAGSLCVVPFAIETLQPLVM